MIELYGASGSGKCSAAARLALGAARVRRRHPREAPFRGLLPTRWTTEVVHQHARQLELAAVLGGIALAHQRSCIRDHPGLLPVRLLQEREHLPPRGCSTRTTTTSCGFHRDRLRDLPRASPPTTGICRLSHGGILGWDRSASAARGSVCSRHQGNIGSDAGRQSDHRADGDPGSGHRPGRVLEYPVKTINWNATRMPGKWTRGRCSCRPSARFRQNGRTGCAWPMSLQRVRLGGVHRRTATAIIGNGKEVAKPTTTWDRSAPGAQRAAGAGSRRELAALPVPLKIYEAFLRNSSVLGAQADDHTMRV